MQGKLIHQLALRSSPYPNNNSKSTISQATKKPRNFNTIKNLYQIPAVQRSRERLPKENTGFVVLGGGSAEVCSKAPQNGAISPRHVAQEKIGGDAVGGGRGTGIQHSPGGPRAIERIRTQRSVPPLATRLRGRDMAFATARAAGWR
jgi:hypothetical protein